MARPLYKDRVEKLFLFKENRETPLYVVSGREVRKIYEILDEEILMVNSDLKTLFFLFFDTSGLKMCKCPKYMNVLRCLFKYIKTAETAFKGN